jgi:hypothetical protein
VLALSTAYCSEIYGVFQVKYHWGRQSSRLAVPMLSILGAPPPHLLECNVCLVPLVRGRDIHPSFLKCSISSISCESELGDVTFVLLLKEHGGATATLRTRVLR